MLLGMVALQSIPREDSGFLPDWAERAPKIPAKGILVPCLKKASWSSLEATKMFRWLPTGKSVNRSIGGNGKQREDQPPRHCWRFT